MAEFTTGLVSGGNPTWSTTSSAPADLYARDQSHEVGKLAEALALAQGEIGAAVRKAENPYYDSRYADLHECWQAWQKVGPKNGLAITQS